MTYAKIENGIVTNLMEIYHNTDEFPDCVPIGDRTVQIGDAYADGVFTRDGEIVKNGRELLADAQADTQIAFSILMGKGDEEE